MPKSVDPSARKPAAAKPRKGKPGAEIAAAAPPPPAADGGKRAKAARGAGSRSKGKSAGAPSGTPRPAKAPARRLPAKTFLVAATIPDGGGGAGLHVYAAVTRGPEAALAAVREALGPEVAVELTGKLSGRMAKALSLKPGDVRRI